MSPQLLALGLKRLASCTIGKQAGADATSPLRRYSWAASLGLRGVFTWTAGGVDYTAADGQARAMWDAVQIFAQTPSAAETSEKLALKTDEHALEKSSAARTTTSGVLASKAPPPQGWVGTYHAAGGNVQDGKNTSAFDVGEGQRLAPPEKRRLEVLKVQAPVGLQGRGASCRQLTGLPMADSPSARRSVN